MIKKMKKYSFIVFRNDYDRFLEELREIGLIHIEEKQKGSVPPEISRYQEAIRKLESYKGGTMTAASESPLEAYEEMQNVRVLWEKKLESLRTDRANLLPWGNFDRRKLLMLGSGQCHIDFHSCPKKKYNPEWEDEFNAFRISEDKSKVYFITITTKESRKAFSGERIIFPTASLEEVEEQIAVLEKKIDGFEGQMADFAASNIEALRKERNAILENIDLSNVKLNSEDGCEDTVRILQGWAPANVEKKICDSLNKLECYYIVSNPTADDDIPIQMSNNRFFSLFEPLTKLYMLPAYGELDLTPFFAPFFMLFFGLCLGDMGYGLLMIVAMPIFDKLFKLINPDFSKWLVLLFGGSTMICGLLTGTAFGFSLYDLDIPLLQKMKGIFYQDNSAMFTISLAIGAVQILFGMILKAFNKSVQLGFVYALSTIGWILLLCTVAVAALTGIGFGNPVVIALLVFAAILIFLLNSPGKNPLLNIGLGLWDTYNMVTGLLGDILSYVRLFALGLSGGILASVFNSLAVGMSPKIPVVGFIVTALIFLAGHAINIFMNFLGAIVHPMRLTFVEFFKNAGYTGGGVEYKPFKKIDKQ